MDASKEGFPESRREQHRLLVLHQKNIFRTIFLSRPQAKVTLLVLTLKPNTIQFIVKIRKYNDSQRHFMRKLAQKLMEKGLSFSNHSSKWSSAPHLVAEAGPSEWWFTIDLLLINKYTFLKSFPLLIRDKDIEKATNCNCYPDFDLLHGYWQLPFHHNSHECQLFITQNGIYTPSRVPHGNRNAHSHIHLSLSEHMLPELRDVIMICVEDKVLPAKNVNDLPTNIGKLFQLCKELNENLHSGKCHLYKMEVKWCGRHVSAYGVKYDPRNIATLEMMRTQVTVGASCNSPQKCNGCALAFQISRR